MVWKVKRIAECGAFINSCLDEDIDEDIEFETREEAEEWLEKNPQDDGDLWTWAAETLSISGYIDIVEE